MTQLLKPNDLDKAAKCLQNGGLVAFPTETVYGLGADALDPEAVKGIFLAKGRPSDNPLIVHIWNTDQLDDLVEDISPDAKKLMDEFWPGPLAIIFKKKEGVPKITSGGLDTLAIRLPDNEIAFNLLKKANVPVAAPSANTSGKPSPVKGVHVMEDLEGKIDYVIEDGKCDIGYESSVVDTTVTPFRLLRPGNVTLEQLNQITKVEHVLQTGEVAKSPGMKYKHYSPTAKVYLVKGDIWTAASKFEDKKVAYIGLKTFTGDMEYIAKDIDDFGRNVFSKFRKFDREGAQVILVEAVPEKGLGLALMNRLKKAGKFLD